MKEGTQFYLERPGLAFFTIGSPSCKKAQIRQLVKDFDPFLAQPIIYFIFFPADPTAIKMRIKIIFWPTKLFKDRSSFTNSFNLQQRRDLQQLVPVSTVFRPAAKTFQCKTTNSTILIRCQTVSLDSQPLYFHYIPRGCYVFCLVKVK